MTRRTPIVLLVAIILVAGVAADWSSFRRWWTPTPVLGGDLLAAPFLAAAYREGLFDAAGASCRIFDTKQDELTIAHVLAGELDFGVVSLTGLAVHLWQGGSGLRILADIGRRTDLGVLVRTAAGVASARDLRGRSVACGQDLSSSSALRRLLATANLQDADVRISHLEDDVLRLRLLAGTVDAALVAEPLLSDLVATSAGRVARLDLGDAVAAPLFLVTSRETAAVEPGSCRRMVDAFRAIAQAHKDRPTETARAAEAELGLPAGTLQKGFESASPGVADPRGSIAALEEEAARIHAFHPGLQGADRPHASLVLEPPAGFFE